MIICHLCKKELNSWDIRCSKALGYKNPRCEICIAKEYGKTKEELREIMAGIHLLKKCDAIYIGRKFGVSQGMKSEIIIARLLELEEKNAN